MGWMAIGRPVCGREACGHDGRVPRRVVGGAVVALVAQTVGLLPGQPIQHGIPNARRI